MAEVKNKLHWGLIMAEDKEQAFEELCKKLNCTPEEFNQRYKLVILEHISKN